MKNEDVTSGNDSQESTIEGQKSKVPNIQIIESVVGEENDGTRSQTTKIDVCSNVCALWICVP